MLNFFSGVYFTNILRAAFTRADPKSAKRRWLYCNFGLLGAARVKAACKMWVKSTPGVSFIRILRAGFLPADKCFSLEQGVKHKA